MAKDLLAPVDLLGVQPPQIPLVNQGIGPLEAGLISAGRGLTTIGRAVGLADPEDPITTQSFRQLQEQRPISTTIGEIAGQTAPFLVPGTAIGAISSLPGRVAASTVLGGLEGAAIARGEGRSAGEQLETAGIAGFGAGLFELVLPSLSRIGGQVVRRVLGKPPSNPVIDQAGNISEEFRTALASEGRTLDDVISTVKDDLSADFVEPEQVARKAFLESQGLQPTRAQITRRADDFQVQQEAAKTSGRARALLEQQEAVLTSRFNNQIVATGGAADSPISTVTNALVDKATVLDQEISNLYTRARQAAPGEKNVRFSGLARKLKKLAPVNRRTGGNIEVIVGDLQSKGVLDANMNVIGKIDVETAEDARKLMNELYDPQNPFANGVLRELKDSLDDDVFSAAGKDVFKEGRAAKAAFEKELSRAKISKFDSRKANLVRDVLENKINPDTFANDVVFSKKWRATDIQQLKDYISTTPDGKSAFDDLRAEVLQSIKEKSFIGPVDSDGFKSLSRDKLEKAISQIGENKLKVLFNPAERKFLTNMLQVAKTREPVRGTALGRGPSAQAIGRLEQKLKEIPGLGALVELINVDTSGRAVLKAKPERRFKPLPSGISPAVGALGVGAAAQEQEQL